MNVLLIKPREKNILVPNYNTYSPIGLGYISAILKREGYCVDCLNMDLEYGTDQEIVAKRLDSRHYDVVGTGYISIGYWHVKVIVDVCKRHPSHPCVVLGGMILTCDPELMFNDLRPDFGVIGNGETTIVELLQEMQGNQNYELVKGIIYKEYHRTIQTTSREQYRDLDSLPYPDYEGFGLRTQLDNNSPTTMSINDDRRTYYILGSRGCPFNCTFCFHIDTYCERSLDNIFSEIEHAVENYGITNITFSDETFGFNRKRMLDFCDNITRIKQERNLVLDWNCFTRVECVDDEILKKLYDAGCTVLTYGFESANQDVLRSMNKNITSEIIRNTIELTFKNRIGMNACFIFGDVKETDDTIKETLGFYRKNCEGQTSLGWIIPMPNSEIYLHCLREGIIKDKIGFIQGLDEKYGPGQLLRQEQESINFSRIPTKHRLLYSSLFLILHYRYRKTALPRNLRQTGDGFIFDACCPYCDKEHHYTRYPISGHKHSFFFQVMCKSCRKRFFVRSWSGFILYQMIDKIPGMEKIVCIVNSKMNIIR